MTVGLGALVIRGNLFILLRFFKYKNNYISCDFFMFFKGNLNF
jgi:hypothetical protein